MKTSFTPILAHFNRGQDERIFLCFYVNNTVILINREVASIVDIKYLPESIVRYRVMVHITMSVLWKVFDLRKSKLASQVEFGSFQDLS